MMAACSRFRLYVVAKSLNKSCMLFRAVDTGYYMSYVVACSRYRLCLYVDVGLCSCTP